MDDSPLSAIEGEERPGIDRRSFLLSALLALLAPSVAAVAKTWGAAVRAGVPAFRPATRGTSARTCARCGAADHSMLDPSCPADVQRHGAIQSEARARARASARRAEDGTA